MIGFKQLNGTTLIGSGTYKFKHISESAPPATPYLTFSSPSSFTLRTSRNLTWWNGTLEYSTDTTTWSTWNGTIISSVNNVLYLRGIGNNKITGSSSASWILNGTNISCNGNIENLLDYQEVSLGNHPTMWQMCFMSLFKGVTSLIKAPELESITLTYMCYSEMFYGCTSLILAPSLPATTMTNSCYMNMFFGCTSLIVPPSLPATTLNTYCYGYMFYGCTSLTTLPQLPANNLADMCYGTMFMDCTNIKVSATQGGIYQYEWRIPTSGNGVVASNWNSNMLINTGGTFNSVPDINTTYYAENEPV